MRSHHFVLSDILAIRVAFEHKPEPSHVARPQKEQMT